jgi:hypothetical protein
MSTKSISEVATDLEECRKAFEIKAQKVMGTHVEVVHQGDGKYVLFSKEYKIPVEILIAPTQPELYIFHVEIK